MRDTSWVRGCVVCSNQSSQEGVRSNGCVVVMTWGGTMNLAAATQLSCALKDNNSSSLSLSLSLSLLLLSLAKGLGKERERD